jgi:hypothetical protein
MAYYCDMLDVKSRLDISGTDQDADIQACVETVSDWIDVHCGYPTGGFAVAANSTRYYVPGDVRGKKLMLGMPCVSVSSVTNGDGAAFTHGVHYRLYPRNGGRFYEMGLLESYDWQFSMADSEIAIVAKFGYSVTPPKPVREFCTAAAAKLFKVYQAALQEASANFETGQLIYRDASIIKLLWMLTPYVRGTKFL